MPEHSEVVSDRDVDFDFGGPPADAEGLSDGSDRLDLTPSTRPPSRLAMSGWSRRTWITLGVIVALVVVVLNGVHHARTSGPRTVSPGPVSTSSRAPSAQEFALDRLVYTAQSNQPLRDNLRAAGGRPSCPAFPVDIEPVQLVEDALDAAVPGFAFVDSSMTMNDDVTLCGVELRARAANGATVVVSVTAPTGEPAPDFVGLRNTDHSQAEVVQGFNAGWLIVAGWVGESGDRAPLDGLMALAASTRLRW